MKNTLFIGEIRKFWQYVMLYWTHYQILSISKRENITIKDDKWYQIQCYVKKADGGLLIDNMSIINIDNIYKNI